MNAVRSGPSEATLEPIEPDESGRDVTLGPSGRLSAGAMVATYSPTAPRTPGRDRRANSAGDAERSPALHASKALGGYSEWRLAF